MFTGIIEEQGEIVGIRHGEKSAVISIKARKVLEGTKPGDSIATNGVCLTVTKILGNIYEADVMAETLRRSNLGMLRFGDKVNLERALTLSGRLGGHIVSGHIDGTGIISDMKQEDNAMWVSVAAPSDILRYIIEKGSITIDGISLTVAYVDDEIFKVSVIPHTGEETGLLKKSTGDKVNLENDIIGKYVEKLLRLQENAPAGGGINMEFLAENGFL